MSPRSCANADAVDGRTRNEVLVGGTGHYLNCPPEVAGACSNSLRFTDSGRIGRELVVAVDLSLALNSHVDLQPFQPS
jgi:hypothetical protein